MSAMVYSIFHLKQMKLLEDFNNVANFELFFPFRIQCLITMIRQLMQVIVCPCIDMSGREAGDFVVTYWNMYLKARNSLFKDPASRTNMRLKQLAGLERYRWISKPTMKEALHEELRCLMWLHLLIVFSDINKEDEIDWYVKAFAFFDDKLWVRTVVCGYLETMFRLAETNAL